MNKYLTKIAALSEDAKKEIKQTAIIATTGLGTGIGGDMLSKTKSISSWKAPSWLKAGVTVGALGLVGDVAAVKVNRRIEKRAGLADEAGRMAAMHIRRLINRSVSSATTVGTGVAAAKVSTRDNKRKKDK